MHVTYIIIPGKNPFTCISLDDGWVLYSNPPDDRLTIYTKKPSDGSTINFCKGIAVINGTPEDIRCVCLDEDHDTIISYSHLFHATYLKS